jgi:hypothetical protein
MSMCGCVARHFVANRMRFSQTRLGIAVGFREECSVLGGGVSVLSAIAGLDFEVFGDRSSGVELGGSGQKVAIVLCLMESWTLFVPFFAGECKKF